MKKILSVLFAFLLFFTAFSQSADVITDILEAETVTVGQICYLTAVQLNLADEKVSYDAAVEVMKEQDFISSSLSAEDPITAKEIAHIYSKCWPVKGGLMFRLSKGFARYAFKQFVSDGVIDSSIDPSDHVTGAKALSFYTSCVSKYSGFNLANVSMEDE